MSINLKKIFKNGINFDTIAEFYRELDRNGETISERLQGDDLSIIRDVVNFILKNEFNNVQSISMGFLNTSMYIDLDAKIDEPEYVSKLLFYPSVVSIFKWIIKSGNQNEFKEFLDRCIFLIKKYTYNLDFKRIEYIGSNFKDVDLNAFTEYTDFIYDEIFEKLLRDVGGAKYFFNSLTMDFKNMFEPNKNPDFKILKTPNLWMIYDFEEEYNYNEMSNILLDTLDSVTTSPNLKAKLLRDFHKILLNYKDNLKDQNIDDYFNILIYVSKLALVKMSNNFKEILDTPYVIKFLDNNTIYDIIKYVCSKSMIYSDQATEILLWFANNGRLINLLFDDVVKDEYNRFIVYFYQNSKSGEFINEIIDTISDKNINRFIRDVMNSMINESYVDSYIVVRLMMHYNISKYISRFELSDLSFILTEIRFESNNEKILNSNRIALYKALVTGVEYGNDDFRESVETFLRNGSGHYLLSNIIKENGNESYNEFFLNIIKGNESNLEFISQVPGDLNAWSYSNPQKISEYIDEIKSTMTNITPVRFEDYNITNPILDLLLQMEKYKIDHNIKYVLDKGFYDRKDDTIYEDTIKELKKHIKKSGFIISYLDRLLNILDNKRSKNMQYPYALIRTDINAVDKKFPIKKDNYENIWSAGSGEVEIEIDDIQIQSKILVRLLVIERKKTKDKTPVKDFNGKNLNIFREPNTIYIDTIKEQYGKKSNEFETRVLGDLIKSMTSNRQIKLDSEDIIELDLKLYRNEYKIKTSEQWRDLDQIIQAYSELTDKIHGLKLNTKNYRSKYSMQSIEQNNQFVFRFDYTTYSLDVENILKKYPTFTQKYLDRLQVDYKNRIFSHSISGIDTTMGWIRYSIFDDEKLIILIENQTDVSKNIGLRPYIQLTKSNKSEDDVNPVNELFMFFDKRMVSLIKSSTKFQNEMRTLTDELTNFILLKQVKAFQSYLMKKYPDYTVILPSSSTRVKWVGGSPSPTAYDGISSTLNFKSKKLSDIITDLQILIDKYDLKFNSYSPTDKIYTWSYLTEMLRGFNI